MHARRRHSVILLIGGALSACGLGAIIGGCSRRPNDSGATPRDALTRLITARQERAYQKIRSLVVAERADEVLAVLMAVDGFLAANRRLCDYVRDEVGVGLAQMIDQSSLGGHLEIFSPYVELLDEVVEDDLATVSFWVDGKLPVKRATLRRVGRTWRYDPGPGYSRQLPKAFDRMADGLRAALADIESGRLSRRALQADPELLVREVRARLLPGVRMLSRPTDPAGQGG